MPSHSPRLPPITEIMVHMEMPVDTVVETSSLNTRVTIYRLLLVRSYLFMKLSTRYEVSSAFGTLYFSL